MSDKTVPVFVEQNGTGERVQVGWATPLEGGVRRLDLYPDYKNVPKGTLRYGDEDDFQIDEDEPAAEADFSDNSEGYAAADTSYSFPAFNSSSDEDEPLPAAPVEDAPDAELAAEPVAPGDFADEEGREDDDLDDVDEEEDFEPDEEESEDE